MARYFDDRRFPYRKVGELTIWFRDAQTVLVKDAQGTTHVFSRWGMSQRNFYTNNWRPFQRAVRRRTKLDVYDIYKLAAKYDISAGVTYTPTKWAV